MSNKLEVSAVAFEAGWAFVRVGDSIKLLRPPYRRQDIIDVGEETLERAISKHGFESASAVFVSWRDLVRFLDDKFLDLRRARGETIPLAMELRKLLNFAPEHVLTQYLDHAESTLLPMKNFEEAIELTTALLRLQKMKETDSLYERAIRIQELCLAGLRQVENDKRELMQPGDDEMRFPLLSKAGSLPQARRTQREFCGRKTPVPVTS